MKDRYTFLITSLSVLLRMTNVSGKFVEEIKTHFVFSNFFLWKSCRLWENVEKYCRAGQATDDNMACALRAVYLRLKTHTLRLYSTQWFPTATTVARTRLNITLYVHCLRSWCLILSETSQIYLIFLEFQCISHQPTSTTDFSWRINHVKALLSSRIPFFF